MSDKLAQRIRRHRRVRAKVKGTARCPRLSVFRSNRHIFAQLIDDESGKTLAAASDITPKKSPPKADSPRAKKNKKAKPKERAAAVGELIAKMAKEKNIERVVFDRGGHTYHGLVREVAEAARRGGLKF